MSPEPRKPRSQIVLEVVDTMIVSRHMVRVFLGGPGFREFENIPATDKYVKIFFVKPELGLDPPYDIEALRASLPQEDWPVVRTYTIRLVDEQRRRLAIDFVVHGDEGVAGPWARGARVGDRIALAGPGGAFIPTEDVAAYVFAGDESATPAIAAALESLPNGATGLAIIEAEDFEDMQLLGEPDGIEMTWVFRSRGESLVAAVAAADWPEGDVQVFAHGERESMKALRAIFAERGVRRELRSLSGYWAQGRTEDRFQAEKREPIGRIDD
ncbi:siderophore-interacting protein [Glaciihabitans arcticus]|uniref:Siderophore-interacting protein n=1 Tax=Glaciihabitans arcticus TaxID=2668039 RepID=A0A4Q9GWB6_9MICO|nr:siderophore-interacting protein [Glaciihabitans arcticus]TBN56510.1 siderophore-interacting protein [Glaciihabitans arcticus]